jgi:hypothetical protein
MRKSSNTSLVEDIDIIMISVLSSHIELKEMTLVLSCFSNGSSKYVDSECLGAAHWWQYNQWPGRFDNRISKVKMW